MGEELRQHISKMVALEDEAWNPFRQNIDFKSYKRKQLLLIENEVCRQLFFIVKGYVRLYYLIDGVETTKDGGKRINLAGDICTFIAILV